MESATFTLRVFNRKTGKDEDRRVMVTWKAEALARQYARKALANKSHKARVARGCVVVTIVDGKMKDAQQVVTPQYARDLLAECGIALGEKYALIRFPARYNLIGVAERIGFKPKAGRKSRIEMLHIRLQLLAAKAE